MKRLFYIALLSQSALTPLSLHAQQNPNGVLQLHQVAQPFLLLVRDPVVHQDLELTDEQLRAVRTLNDELDAGMWARRNQNPEESAKTTRALTTKTMQKLASILSVEQLNRIGQIRLWLLGVKSLARQDVSKEVGLDAEQTSQVRDIVSAAQNEIAQLYQELEDGGDKHELNLRYRQVQKRQQEQLVEMLTDEQAAKWRAMLGRRIDVSKLGRIKFKAPRFASDSGWVNSDPLTMDGLRGKVVALHFYALSCINCQRNYPWYKDWQSSLSGEDFIVVGIHTPEYSSEEGVHAVGSDAKSRQLDFPILVDDEKKNWAAWGNSMWPSVYLIDKQGYVRYWWYGELNWQNAEGHIVFRKRIQELMAEADPS